MIIELMPELPEVEVTRLSFADRIAGASVQAVELGLPLRWPLGCEEQSLVGQTVLQVRRRGKYLLLDLSEGLLLIHLGMSGRLMFDAQLPVRSKHDHFEMRTSQGVLRLTDPRRFGAVVFSPSQQHPSAQKLLRKLGVEPLQDDFTVSDFEVQLKRKKTSIKSVLLAGEVVVGVGNIYASEALFMAGIKPTVLACKLSGARVVRLHAAVREVLSLAVKKGGSTLKDFVNAQGHAGGFQLDAKVYGRAGLPCKECGMTIKQIRQGQRSTFFCSGCQR